MSIKTFGMAAAAALVLATASVATSAPAQARGFGGFHGLGSVLRVVMHAQHVAARVERHRYVRTGYGYGRGCWRHTPYGVVRVCGRRHYWR